MSNNTHGLTYKDDDGKVQAHPLYWVWHANKKTYKLADEWADSVLDFVTWAESHGWEKGKDIRRYDSKLPFSEENCYVHTRGEKLSVKG